jgi:hypothetical protein
MTNDVHARFKRDPNVCPDQQINSNGCTCTCICTTTTTSSKSLVPIILTDLYIQKKNLLFEFGYVMRQ